MRYGSWQRRGAHPAPIRQPKVRVLQHLVVKRDTVALPSSFLSIAPLDLLTFDPAGAMVLECMAVELLRPRAEVNSNAPQS
jgi:hypothetical protein